MSPRLANKRVWVIALWACAYVFLMGTIITQMTRARQRHEDAIQSSTQKPMSVPSTIASPQGEGGMLSPEGILQDHFALYLTALIGFTTLVYGVMMYLFCGVTLGNTSGPVTLEQELQNDQCRESADTAGEVASQQGLGHGR